MNLDEIIKKLRELNEPVPKPLQLPTTDEVDIAQHRMGVTFHPDYRKYLLEASDVVFGTKEPCTVTPDGGHTDLISIAWLRGNRWVFLLICCPFVKIMWITTV